MDGVAFGGRFVTQTAVFLGAEGVGAGFEVDAEAVVEEDAGSEVLPLILEVFEV